MHRGRRGVSRINRKIEIIRKRIHESFVFTLLHVAKRNFITASFKSFVIILVSAFLHPARAYIFTAADASLMYNSCDYPA